MSISLQIYDNTSKKTNIISVDFVSDFLATSVGGDPNDIQYFFKFTTGSRDTSNLTYAPRYITNLTDLALNKTKQSATNTAAAYTDISAMITDEIYDYIYGHTADKFSSGCTLKAPMKF